MKLRDYQAKLILDSYASFSAGNQGVVCVSPTGSGKMVTLTYMAKRGTSPILILFHVRELAFQCMRTLDAWGCDYRKIISGEDDGNISSNIHVAMMQTFWARRDKLPRDYGRIIIDEGHHAKASTYTNIFDLMPDVKRLAFTATPIRLDGTGLIDNTYFHDIVIGPQPSELLKQGYLAPIRMFTQNPADLDFSRLRITAGDYNQKDLNEMMEQSNHGKIVGDSVRYYKKYCQEDTGLACCTSVRHAELVAEEFSNKGIQAITVSGKTPKRERKRIIEAYGRKEIKILTYAQVFGEGIDLPDACAMFYLRPTKSLSTWKQNCGRVARIPYKEKKAFVFDHVGQSYTTFAGQSMGHPYQDTDWLDVIYRQQESKRDNGAKVPKIYERCDECLSVYPASLPICPECGYNSVSERTKRAELERIEGELKEQREIDAAISKSLDDIYSLKELQAYAKGKGYKSGWAWYQFKRKRGGFKQDKEA